MFVVVAPPLPLPTPVPVAGAAAVFESLALILIQTQNQITECDESGREEHQNLLLTQQKEQSVESGFEWIGLGGGNKPDTTKKKHKLSGTHEI